MMKPEQSMKHILCEYYPNRLALRSAVRTRLRHGVRGRGKWQGGILLALGLLLTGRPQIWAAGEQLFKTPQAAADALVAAARTHDTNALHFIFGPSGRELINPDVIQSSNNFARFVQRLTNKVELIQAKDGRTVLELGADGWPFPIPLAPHAGQWFFDTAAGREEILNRRIGENELGALGVVRAYAAAQREYASQFHGNEEVLEYAQHLRSTPGRQDGLYWPLGLGSERSPLGPLVAGAHAEGYRKGTKILTEEETTPYHGYYFRILTQQGNHASGGKYHYIINGHMIAGFALVAWPAEWGNSGIMTFIINQRGKLYQKNLGAKTDAVARGMLVYDPDPTWKSVAD